MASRKSPTSDVEAGVLLASRRRCCICYGLNRDLEVKQGQIAHINRDPSDSEPDNLAFMCLPHHDLFDTKTSQSKGWTVAEARHYREALYAEWRCRDEAEASGVATALGANQVGTPTSRRAAPPIFQPIDAVDDRLNFRWIIRVTPLDWLDEQDPVKRLTPAEVMRILDGPYHNVASCHERLGESGGSDSLYFGSAPRLEDRCPGCGIELFRPANHSIEARFVDAWVVRAQALAELQRMRRGGASIEGPRVILLRPQYWKRMLPPSAPLRAT